MVHKTHLNVGSVYFDDFSSLAAAAGGNTSLYFNPRRNRRLTPRSAKLVVAAGVKVERSFNFGRGARSKF